MLVLNSKDIKYCRLSYERDCSEEVCLGISYQGLLLAKVGSFTKQQYAIALAMCREFLERDKLISIVIKEKNKITLWSEIPQISFKEDALKTAKGTEY